MGAFALLEHLVCTLGYSRAAMGSALPAPFSAAPRYTGIARETERLSFSGYINIPSARLRGHDTHSSYERRRIVLCWARRTILHDQHIGGLRSPRVLDCVRSRVFWHDSIASCIPLHSFPHPINANPVVADTPGRLHHPFMHTALSNAHIYDPYFPQSPRLEGHLPIWILDGGLGLFFLRIPSTSLLLATNGRH